MNYNNYNNYLKMHLIHESKIRKLHLSRQPWWKGARTMFATVPAQAGLRPSTPEQPNPVLSRARCS
jgi:hypothetical protein